MITINCMRGRPLDHKFTDADVLALKQENKDKNYSYQCLMNEVISNESSTLSTLLTGWGGVKLVK